LYEFLYVFNKALDEQNCRLLYMHLTDGTTRSNLACMSYKNIILTELDVYLPNIVDLKLVD